jgi:hypothetical protein
MQLIVTIILIQLALVGVVGSVVPILPGPVSSSGREFCIKYVSVPKFLGGHCWCY